MSQTSIFIISNNKTKSMSVVIEFIQIVKQNIISENKIFGLFEVELDMIEWGDGCHLKTEIFQNLQDDANNWGEVYLQPSINNFIFYLLAVDTECELGIRTENETSIISALNPSSINEYIQAARKHTEYGKSGVFDKLSEILVEAIAKDLLIVTRIS